MSQEKKKHPRGNRILEEIDTTKKVIPNENPESDENYKTGYKKPPKHARWKKGQSGNPKGRPKGSKNFKTELRDALAAHIEITENRKRVKLSVSEAIIKVLLQNGLKGKLPALNKIMDLALMLDDEEDNMAKLSPSEAIASDADIIEAYLLNLFEESKPVSVGNDDDVLRT